MISVIALALLSQQLKFVEVGRSDLHLDPHEYMCHPSPWTGSVFAVHVAYAGTKNFFKVSSVGNPQEPFGKYAFQDKVVDVAEITLGDRAGVFIVRPNPKYRTALKVSGDGSGDYKVTLALEGGNLELLCMQFPYVAEPGE